MRIVSLVVAFLSVTVVLIAAGIGHTAPAATKVTLTDYKFGPDLITARAGQSVTIRLVNATSQKKLHEFMVGRKVAKGKGGRPAGYERDLFDGVVIKASNVQGVWKWNKGGAQVSGVRAKIESGDMAMGDHDGFMIELQAGGTATLTFILPADRVGEWEIGCFSEAGDHYLKGMKGKFVVVR